MKIALKNNLEKKKLKKYEQNIFQITNQFLNAKFCFI
jgi:hypothetical protein